MWGFHPLLADLDRGDGASEALASRLRPGNAGANNAADHVAVCAEASWQLPELPAGLRRLVRADSAGASMNSTQILTLDGELRLAESQQLRRTLLPVPASIAPHARKWWLHCKAGWPWTPALVAAFQRLRCPAGAAGRSTCPKSPHMPQVSIDALSPPQPAIAVLTRTSPAPRPRPVKWCMRPLAHPWV
jgi:hypothetical protein